MLSKNKQKYIRSLSQKKYRDEENVFIAEGPKLVEELMEHFQCLLLVKTSDYSGLFKLQAETEVIEVNKMELTKVSNLKTPQSVLAVFKKPAQRTINQKEICKSLCLALDAIQDPGNLGTIIRIADWFGIEHIFCSPDTADAFSPKTIQATMGAIGRVKIYYLPLKEFISSLPKDYPVYGTFLNGEDIYRKPLKTAAMVVMGNEGNGISPEIEKLVSDKILIPNFPAGRETSESLNVAVATAITCAEFRRQSSI